MKPSKNGIRDTHAASIIDSYMSLMRNGSATPLVSEMVRDMMVQALAWRFIIQNERFFPGVECFTDAYREALKRIRKAEGRGE